MSSKCYTQPLCQDHTLNSSVFDVSCPRKSHEGQSHRLPHVEKMTRPPLSLQQSLRAWVMVLDSLSQTVHEATTVETLQ